MIKSKFLEIVRTFTPDEFRGFRNFVRSPFHNTNKNVIKIAEILKAHFPELNDPKLEKEVIYKKLYPGKNYNDTVMRIILSDLLKLAEEYLAYHNYNNHSIDEKIFLLEELDERKLYILFNRHLKESRDELDKDNLIDINYFLKLFELESQNIDSLIARGKQPETAGNVLMQGEYLINFFLINILNIAHELAAHEEFLEVKFEYNIVKEFMDSLNLKKFLSGLEKNEHKFYSVILIYYYMYMSVSDKYDFNEYIKLKDLVFENLHLFRNNEKFNLFIILESICTSAITSGKRNFYGHIMNVYEAMLENKAYTHKESEYFQLNLFRNIMYTGITLKRFDWVDEFVTVYKDKLMPKYRDELPHLASAMISFEKKNFDKALQEISLVRFDYYVFKYDIRMLTLKIYYEMNSFEPALSLIDTFTHFLNNTKSTSEYYKESFERFLKFTKQLIRIKSGSGKTVPGEIRKEIERTERLINKNWLLEKALELES